MFVSPLENVLIYVILIILCSVPVTFLIGRIPSYQKLFSILMELKTGNILVASEHLGSF